MNCYQCVHRLPIAGNCHSRCNNFKADNKLSLHGVKNGWCNWPLNFDPIWVTDCNGYSENEKDKLPLQKLDPILEIMALLK